MQKAIEQLISLGPLPAEENADVNEIKEIELLIQNIELPLSMEETVKLVTLFSSDSCFGLAWTLLHLIEATPGWSAKEQLVDNGNEWVQRLLQRGQNRELWFHD